MGSRSRRGGERIGGGRFSSHARKRGFRACGLSQRAKKVQDVLPRRCRQRIEVVNHSAVATLDGALNSLPSSISLYGPLREVRRRPPRVAAGAFVQVAARAQGAATLDPRWRAVDGALDQVDLLEPRSCRPEVGLLNSTETAKRPSRSRRAAADASVVRHRIGGVLSERDPRDEQIREQCCRCRRREQSIQTGHRRTRLVSRNGLFDQIPKSDPERLFRIL